MTGGEYGVLLSHAHEHHVTGGLTTAAAATELGETVAAAQPGIEYEVMVRDPGGSWRSLAAGRTPAQVARDRWP